jgi:predicted CopG family antitoxin
MKAFLSHQAFYETATRAYFFPVKLKCRHFYHLVEKMTETKTVKISKETYNKLSEVAGELQMKLKRPVSLDEAVWYLLSLKKRGKRTRITDLAGSWDMSSEEWTEIKASLTEAWRKWKLSETKS